MKKVIKFPHINQLRNVVETVRHRAEYHSVTLPKLTFHGTVKLHGCFASNTKITLANGEHVPICEIEKDTYILSYDVKTKKTVSKKVNAVVIQELDKDWLELKLENNKTVKCTVDHKFYTQRGWVEAQFLSFNDNIIDEDSVCSINSFHVTNESLNDFSTNTDTNSK